MTANSPGLYKGKHYTQWVDDVKWLKRENKFDECLILLFGLIEATEREAKAEGWPYAAPWYYEQAAIIFRKLKRYEDEIQVLKRWGNGGPQFDKRIRAARALSNNKRLTPQDKKVLRYHNTCLEFAADIGAGEDYFKKELLALTSEFIGKGMPPPKYGDVFWKIANKYCVQASLNSDFAALGRLRRTMAEFLVFEKRDWVQMAEQSVWAFVAAIMLQNQKREASDLVTSINGIPFRLSELAITGCKCEKCLPDNGKRQPLSFFENKNIYPLPHRDCLKPPCSCIWHESSC